MKPDQTYPETAVELFALRDSAGTILYAPIGQLMARVNEPAAACALAYAADQTARDGMTDDERAVVDELAAHGFFDERPLPHSEEEFCPLQVTLFPTNRCNLRCSYCYAFGGEGGASGEPLVEMSPAIAHAAIDLIAGNARVLAGEGCNVRCFIVSIHGNGEPFCAFDLMREIVRYGNEVAERVGIPVVFNAATNGVLNDEQPVGRSRRSTARCAHCKMRACRSVSARR